MIYIQVQVFNQSFGSDNTIALFRFKWKIKRNI